MPKLYGDIIKGKEFMSFEFTNKENFYNNMKNNRISFPYILKINNFCGGKGTYIINNEEEVEYKLNEIIKLYNDKKNAFSKILCIKYIKSKSKSRKFFISYRIIATQNEIISGYVRISKNWIVQWSTSKFTKDIENEFILEQIKCEKIIKENKELICKAVKSVNLDGVGLDLLIDNNTNKIYFLEAQIGFSTGYPNTHKPPYYRPDDPNMVNFLFTNKNRLSQIIPLYYNNWLNKNNCFKYLYESIYKMNRRKKLYCDIDSTINNHWVRIQKWALPNYPGDRIHKNAFSREEIMKDELLPGAKESIERFIEEGWEVHFLTARGFKDAYNITKDWLDLKQIPYNSINCVKSSKDKPGFLKNREVDLFIDDLSAGQEYSESYKNLYINTINKLNEYKIPFVIFKGDWYDIKY